jgi:hypothetical protein
MRPQAEAFRLIKFVEDKHFSDPDMDFPRQTSYYDKGNPRIKMEKGQVIVWNDQYQTSLKVGESEVHYCVLSEPAVLVIKGKNNRVTCFISEEPDKVIKLGSKFSVAKQYIEMR